MKIPAKYHPWRERLLSFTLAGAPELNLFEWPGQRDRALREVATEALNPFRFRYWMAAVIIVTAVLAILRVVDLATSYLTWPPIFDVLLRLVVWIFTFMYVLRMLHRHALVRPLREKLLNANVPVCLQCGYCLRGMPLSAGRCPECGQPFDDKVQTLLRAITSTTKA